MQDQLALKTKALSDASSEIDRLKDEISQISGLHVEKTTDAERLAAELDNSRKNLEVGRSTLLLSVQKSLSADFCYISCMAE